MHFGAFITRNGFIWGWVEWVEPGNTLITPLGDNDDDVDDVDMMAA